MNFRNKIRILNKKQKITFSIIFLFLFTISFVLTPIEAGGPNTTLKITKLTTGGNGAFAFTVTGPTSFNPNIFTSAGTGTSGLTSVNPGTYSIQEAIPSGWNLNTASCNDGSSTFSVDTVSGIVVDFGDNIECTFENEKLPQPTIKITKLTTGGDDTFDFTVTGPTSFNPTINTVAGTGMSAQTTINPGTYSIQEIIPSDWLLNTASCNDGSSTFSVDTVSGIVIGFGDNIECTFENEINPLTTLKITKLTTGGDGTFDFIVIGPTQYNPSISTTAGEGITVPTLIDPGTYSIQEAIPSGWNLNTASCNDGSSTFSVDTVSGIVIGLGDDIECTFENEKLPQPTIKITKLVIGGNGEFDFIATGPTPFDTRIFASAGTGTSGLTLVNPGTYSIQEIIPSEWNLNTASCNDGSSTFSVDTVSGIVVDFGDNIECTFENEINPLTTLKITKIVTGGHDTFDFTVIGPTSYTPNITTAPSYDNLGTFGVIANAFYYVDENPTTFISLTAPPLINEGVYQEGTNPEGVFGEIRLGSDESKSQWEFLQKDDQFPNQLININLWVNGNFDGPQQHPILATFDDILARDTDSFVIFTDGSQTRIRIIENGNVRVDNGYVGIPPNDGQWHMLTIFIDKTECCGENSAMYLDGVQMSESFVNPGSIFDGSGGPVDFPLTIGGHFSQGVVSENGFNVDDVAIWSGSNRLSQSEISTLYNSGAGAPATSISPFSLNLYGYWSFDDTTANGIGGNAGIGLVGPTPVDPGTYSIQEAIPSGWNLNTASCNDGSSTFSVDTVSGIVLSPGDDIECTFENEIIPSPTIQITKLTTGGDDTFDFTVTGPTTYGQTIATSTGTGISSPISVNPGTYSIKEIIPSDWLLNTASCNDGSSTFSVDTVSGIVLSPGDEIECIFENAFSISNPDTDGDKIYNEVDTLPNTPSNEFSDVVLGGTSFGTITSRGQQILTVTEALNPTGVRIVADITGGLVPATINACGGLSIINLDAGDDIFVTCGSITIDVTNGPVEVTFIGSQGVEASATLNTGDNITFEPETFSIINNGPNVIVINISGLEIPIISGEESTVNTITEDVNNNLEINTGEILLINGATINGNIDIDGGILILSNDVTINGNVDLWNDGSIIISSSIIEGNVDSDEGKSVIILESIIDGNLKVDETESVEISQNTVNGNTHVKDNSSVLISNNTVDGNLQIKKNTDCTYSNNIISGNSDIKDCTEV